MKGSCDGEQSLENVADAKGSCDGEQSLENVADVPCS